MSTLPIIDQVERASFSIWSKDDIKQISVKKITEPKSFEKAGELHPDGLYALELGPTRGFQPCPTCMLTHFECPGHYGHIELSVPVYHPMLVQIMYQVISKCCLECYHFRLAPARLKLFLAQLDALNCGFDHLIDELDEIAADLFRENSNENDSYLQYDLGKKLIARIKEEKEKIPNFDINKRPQQRNIVERFSKVFRNFINGRLIKPAKVCPNCGEKKTAISLHQSSVLVLGTYGSNLFEPKGKPGRKGKSSSEQIDLNLSVIKMNEKKVLTPIGARTAFRRIWRNERRTMERIFHFLNMGKSDEEVENDIKDEEGGKKEFEENPISETEFQSVDRFFIDTILVSPSKFRPPMMQRGYSYEGPRTAALSTIMKQSIAVQGIIDDIKNEKEKLEVNLLLSKLQTAWRELQKSVNVMYDNEMDKYSNKLYPGLKQLIDKKEGLFRKNMMGKRVNFAARSVISPDPNILVDQIGVPLVFAKRLTYPEPVAPYNIEKLREAILNGPDKYPGAVSIVYDDGATISLMKETVRQQIASRLSYNPRSHRITDPTKLHTPKATIVNRHLLSGDMLLFNRQPTLHKPSIMAFRARVLPNEKGFRLHYANCKSFNADFDGDEMNAHLPQSELARSEACNIASVNYQYLVPKDGTPLSGLIQDHVVALCILTNRDQFLERDRYNQLIYSALEFLDKPLKIEQPAILRPKLLWTGKQVITTIIKNCIPDGKTPPSLEIKSKIGPKILNIDPKLVSLSDCNVVISKGELLVGYMDKSNIGGTQYGLIHTCYELYGGETSSYLLSAFARLSTWYLQLYQGFTLGIGDILLEEDADYDRTLSIRGSLELGPDSAKEALGLEKQSVSDHMLEEKLRAAHCDRNPLPMKKLDAAMKIRTDKIASEISSRSLPEGLIRKFPDNNLQMMIQSGAKGGTVNALQISCLLGQIELEGRRVPLSMSGRSLPSFKPYDTSPKAGGFVTGRFLTGIQPQEFFFHCMAGREGLIDTAVKTSRSGYLQRCLIKHLEGLTVHYDQTVRDSCGSVIQFLYGEDGLDIVKCQMLKDKAFPLLVENHRIIAPSNDEMEKLNQQKVEYENDVIERIDDIQRWLDKNGCDRVRRVRGSGFLDFLTAKLREAGESFDEVADICKKEEDGPFEEQVSDLNGERNLRLSKHDVSEVQSSERILSKVTVKGTPIIGFQHHDSVFEAWYALSFKEKRKWNKLWESCPDPLTALLNPASHFGVVPEKLDERIEAFVRANPSLIVDSASILNNSTEQADVSNLESYIACDENPELSKSILVHLNDASSTMSKPKMTKHEFYNLCYNLYMKMLAQPGEAVGLLAAQSIGEPSTQMTLNTFHFAGRGEMNVTLGIPRLREILMTASAKIGTPSMDLPLLKTITDEFGNPLDKDAIEEKAKYVKLALNAVRLSDVLEYVDITEQAVIQTGNSKGIETKVKSGKPMKRSRESALGDADVKQIRYDITFVILPRKFYKHEFKSKSKTILKFIEQVFKTQLADAMIKRIKRLERGEELFDLILKSKINLKQDGQTKGDQNPDEDSEEKDLDDYNAKATAKERMREDESSSDDGDDEGDNTTQRLKNRRDQDLDYEEPEVDDLQVDGGDAKAAEDEEGDQDVMVNEEDEDGKDVVDKMSSKLVGGDEHSPDMKEENIVNADSESSKKTNSKRSCKITLFAKLTTSKLDMGNLVSTEAKTAFVHQVGNIQRAFMVKRGSNCEIKTEGVSLLSLVNFNQILDLNAIYTNDIHAIANTYGIEAAAQAIRREMANVFSVYGIEVDSRHLSLIADYMTYNGSIRGMNRMSMEASASPFQQMSFESTIRYLKWATICGFYDDIKSPSASLVFGRPTRGGTGSFGLLADRQKAATKYKYHCSSTIAV